MSSWEWWVPWMVYGPMGAIGAGWAYSSRGAVFSAPVDIQPWAFPRSALLVGLSSITAIALAFLVVGATRLLVRRTSWARRLHLTLRSALLGSSPGRIALLSLLSATAEELFFRAALLPSVGLVVSSLLFGAAHLSPRGGRAWGLWAFVMGLLFGALFIASGSLVPCLLAHALINYENMHYICNYDPTPLDIDRLAPQESRRESV